MQTVSHWLTFVADASYFFCHVTTKHNKTIFFSKKNVTLKKFCDKSATFFFGQKVIFLKKKRQKKFLCRENFHFSKYFLSTTCSERFFLCTKKFKYRSFGHFFLSIFPEFYEL